MTDNSFHTPGFGWANNSKAVNLHPNTIKLSSSTDFDLFTGLLNELPTEFIVDLTKLSSILQDSLRTYFGNSEHHNDYEEFLLTGKSGGRVLRWNLMDIKANSSFQLHAHPNIELILVLSGVMNEYRLKVN